MEEIVMELIINAGCARSKAMESIMEIKEGNSEAARKNMQEADDLLLKAHNIQTKLIQNEVNGEKTELNLLMVHAQDQIMNALTMKLLATEIVEMYEKFS
ncbi:PTS lactose/cellobiose transporter subunit IIA [Clostridium sp. YIM B02506]|uniref:PTS lactose/cellobiose transporter subunit IIA n=1 Tax=Clostridium sp. YIM B02506 TaxID=2910680 RepID=UPI0023B13A84|nr:PTS lactose/cellobiose transporter subunit IIA [Clostridium sp. YIM B02506]